MSDGQQPNEAGEGPSLDLGVYGPQASTGYWIQRIARSMSEHFERELMAHGLTSGLWPILGALYGGDASTPSGVAKFLGLDPSAVTRQLDRLERAELLVRVRKGSDRRSVSLELTKKGMSLVPKLGSLSTETNERFLRGVSPEERTALLETIKKMLGNADHPVKDL